MNEAALIRVALHCIGKGYTIEEAISIEYGLQRKIDEIKEFIYKDRRKATEESK